MLSDTAQSKSGKNTGEAREPVVRRKVVTGKLKVGTGVEKMDNGASLEQKRDIIQVNESTGRNKGGEAGDGRPWKQTTKNSLTELKLTEGKEKQSGNERKTRERVKKMEKTETTGRFIKEEKDKVEARKGSGDVEKTPTVGKVKQSVNERKTRETVKKTEKTETTGRFIKEENDKVEARKGSGDVEKKLTVGKVKQSVNERKTRETVNKMEKTETTGTFIKEENDKVKARKGSGDVEKKLTVGKVKQSVNERKARETVKKMKKTETTGRFIKEEKDKVEARKGSGDVKKILQKPEEEKESWLVKSGLRAAGKGAQTGNKVKKTLSRTKSIQSFVVEDYLQLLKLLKIKLPQGVLTLEVIKHSTVPNVTRDAQAIVQDLENFRLRFITNPRLGCREVKHALNLQKIGNAQEITRIIFFESTKDSEKTLKTTWETNRSNTGHGFRMRDKYTTTPVSTPAMYTTAETRSWSHFESGKDIARITNGVRVNVQELEKMEFRDESLFNQAQSSPQRFGCFFTNPSDEKECLKFFHELREIVLNYEKLTYTKGNKLEFGFLTGHLDFLAEARLKPGLTKSKETSTTLTEKIIIECKGTTGDMVDKLFTKPHDGSCKAEFIETHEYCYQTQTYMYILKKVKLTPPTVRGVMVVRHYHSNSSNFNDFYWNFLKKDYTKQIDALRVYCQKEALPRFLAVLSLIFEKETDILKKP